ncbi:hypothetical protein [Phyllobacterium myrsinacearum]|uniref:Uncharacterized protein n=1 Tax=Phyllobacterium myrsinacearum TaxID=28101 RepID=A0A839EIA9_9HYPH|nr:hypothetical protein [Phyllobacterium myrsinacearum]MBA8877226.1 hypothetical protein [Phyllobacterium myrsinacearum]
MFAVPPYASNEESVHEIILRVLHWSSMADGGAPVSLFRISNLDEVLSDSQCWPIEPDLQALFELYNLSHVFAVHDIVRSYTSLFARLELWGDQHPEVVECNAIELQPDILAQQQQHPAIINHSKMVYMNQAFYESRNADKAAFVASALPHMGPLSTVLNGEIIEIEGRNSDDIELPFSLSQNVRLLDRIDDIETFVPAEIHWDAAEKNEDLFVAISFGCLTLSKANGQPISLSDVPRFSIGSNFYSSLQNIQAGPGQPRAHLLLECCCRIVLGIPKNEIKAMGKPAQTVRVKDQATAWRTHVTKKHEGSRLMLWQSKGIFEFANVGVKLEEHIESGNSQGCYSHYW